MRTRTLSVSRACQQACAFCNVADQLDRSPVDPRALRAALDAARRDGVERIVLTGGEPTQSGQLINALAYANAQGLHTVLATNGRVLSEPGIAGRLRATGIGAVWLSLHGATEATHNALTGGDPLAFRQTTQALAALVTFTQVTVRTVLTRHNAAELGDLLALAARHGAAFELRAPERQGTARARWQELALPPVEAWAALEQARAGAAALGVPFEAHGFTGCGLHGARHPDAGATVAEAAAALRAGALSPRVLGGVHGDPAPYAAATRCTPTALGLLWAASHAPILDLPVEAGGVGPSDPSLPRPTAWSPARRVDVVITRLDAPLASLSTLPALAAALRARGVDARLHTPFPDTFDPLRVAPPEPARGLGRLGAGLRQLVRGAGLPPAEQVDPAQHQPLLERFLDGLDLRGADTVVVWGSPARLRARLGPDVRLEVVEDQLLADPDPPGPRDVLRSPFAAHAALHLAAGVPLRQVHHRPLPLHSPHVRPTRGADVLVIRGAKDDPALLSALTGLRTLDHLPAPSALREALRGARALVLPWARRPEPQEVIWLSVALAARLPLVAPEVAGVTDHVRDGVHGLLIPPGDADALRDALAALQDDAVVARLSQGSAAVDVEAWADELARGAPAARAFPAAPGLGPWTPWA